MVKKIGIGAVLTLGILTVSLILWPPTVLKTTLFNDVAKNISESIPYNVRIGKVTGNLFTGFIFKDVRVRAKSNPGELLRIKQVTLSLSGWALVFHKEVRIQRLEIDLDPGKALLTGEVFLKPVVSGQCVIVDKDFPLEKLFALAGQAPPAFSLNHTGQWTVRKDSQTVAAVMEGRLNGARIRLNVFGAGLRLNGTVQFRSALAEADVRFRQGVGTYATTVGPADFASTIQGTINLPRRSIDGHGTLKKALWQNTRLTEMNFTFRADAKHQSVKADASDIQWRTDAPKPMDITSAQLSIDGNSPRWASTAALKFRDGSSAAIVGFLIRREASWRLTWQKLTAAFPFAGSWTAQEPGSITWSTPGPLTVRALSLVNGTQALHVPQAVFNKTTDHLVIEAKQFDPAPWTKLFVPDLSISGILNASFQLDRTRSALRVDGFFNGQFQNLTAAPLGLSAQNVDMQLRSVGQKLEIVRFTGKTKKGDIQITGSSQLPRLAYALHARKLVLQPYPKTSATMDMDLQLSGTLKAPALTGQITVAEATYTVPRKEKKATTAAQALPPGRMDVQVQWPRNVWFRDGVSSIETEGDVRIQKLVNSPQLLLTGTVTSLRGTYSYFGRTFTIDSGQIEFAGTPDINPNLNVEASYASGPTTVYLDITGTAQSPVLKMHSNPPLSDEDIVSVIAFGQPLNELRTQTGGATSNQEMMQAAGGVLGSYVAKGLNQTGIPALDFDVLNIQQAGDGGSQLTVGRYLTRRLFISYGQTVQGSAEKTITADYFLTNKWTLEGASDSVEGNFLDFLFRYPLNKSGTSSNTSPLPNSPFRSTLDSTIIQQPFRTPMQ